MPVSLAEHLFARQHKCSKSVSTCRKAASYTATVARQRSPFLAPSERALEFGRQYALVLQRWSELFAAASALVEANVRLGELATDAAAEFDAWLQRAAQGPFAWANPEMLKRFMEGSVGRQGPES